MPRNRVLSFMSQWASNSPDSRPSTPPAQQQRQQQPNATSRATLNEKPLPPLDTVSAQNNAAAMHDVFARQSPTPHSPSAASRARADSRQGTRPLSMVQAYQAPQVDVALDTPPELQPIFGYLNSHGNKLYQEGYFLKLHDLDSRGRPSPDRTWVECFAQLIGTVLSLWDAAALDAAGVDGEVVPTFINLSDAALKMIESLPMSGAQGGRLQNVLSISTAANNRYLLHFNSLNSLTQWTAGIRLAMFEHATLQEAYTGSLIAGKGKHLNNIKTIMERARFPTEDWARVRFGAGTPWRRLWFVITPPDEKEFQKSQKMQKKGASYLRSELPRGDIKFYDTRKVTKKTKPVATINDVFACYAIYPQSKPLIEQSTLVKLEGLVTIHSSPETTAEGFVFVMPEAHPAVSGFEMMLRWLFPVWDTFNIYGRPTRLIADTLDQRGLMFAMPRDRRYGYLDTLDVSALIHETGSQAWSERQWRKQLKKLTSDRMNSQMQGPDVMGQIAHRRVGSGPRQSPTSRPGVRFNEDGDSTHSTPHSRSGSPARIANGDLGPVRRTDSAPPGQQQLSHRRSTSEAQGYKKYHAETPSRLSHEMQRQDDYRPNPPRHENSSQSGRPSGPGVMQRIESGVETPTLSSLQAGLHPTIDPMKLPPEPVNSPPAFTHSPSSRPANQPAVPPELRRAHSGVDAATLFQMQEASTQQDRATADDEYRQLTNQMVATSSHAKRNLGRSNADLSQGPSGSVPAVNMQQHTDGRPALGMLVGSALRSDSSEHTAQARAQQYSRRQDHPLPAPPPVDFQRPAMLAAMSSSSSISRKPLARKPLPGVPPSESVARSEHGNSKASYIDNEALERVLSDDARLNSMGSIASSTATDYASAGSNSGHSQKSIERPRMGVLKTVGSPEMPSSNPYAQPPAAREVQRAMDSGNIPTIDFGPTQSHTVGTHFETDTASRAYDRDRSRSSDRRSAYLGESPQRSPNERNRLSYFGGDGAAEYGSRPGYRNSVGGNPYAAAVPSTSQTALSAEQWVQQRAAIANQPQAAPRTAAPNSSHTRQSSSVATVKPQRKLLKSPPASDTSGPSSSRGQQHSVSPSKSIPRGAQGYFGQASPYASSGTSPNSIDSRGQARSDRSAGFTRKPSRNEHAAPGVATRSLRDKPSVSDSLRNGQSADMPYRSRQQYSESPHRRGSPGQQSMANAQQQFQQDLQAAKLAYARSTENLRAYRSGHGYEDPRMQQQYQQPQQHYGQQQEYERRQYEQQQQYQQQYQPQHGSQHQQQQQQQQRAWDQRHHDRDGYGQGGY